MKSVGIPSVGFLTVRPEIVGWDTGFEEGGDGGGGYGYVIGLVNGDALTTENGQQIIINR